mmetsp:Transcript_10795/g.23030  ORF Transcript_10795/g.23030 Transcript_10795/m.23030 type:complete len:261 (-) Transcript_10795:1080-1862(-)
MPKPRAVAPTLARNIGPDKAPRMESRACVRTVWVAPPMILLTAVPIASNNTPSPPEIFVAGLGLAVLLVGEVDDSLSVAAAAAVETTVSTTTDGGGGIDSGICIGGALFNTTARPTMGDTTVAGISTAAEVVVAVTIVVPTATAADGLLLLLPLPSSGPSALVSPQLVPSGIVGGNSNSNRILPLPLVLVLPLLLERGRVFCICICNCDCCCCCRSRSSPIRSRIRKPLSRGCDCDCDCRCLFRFWRYPSRPRSSRSKFW